MGTRVPNNLRIVADVVALREVKSTPLPSGSARTAIADVLADDRESGVYAKKTPVPVLRTEAPVPLPDEIIEETQTLRLRELEQRECINLTLRDVELSHIDDSALLQQAQEIATHTLPASVATFTALRQANVEHSQRGNFLKAYFLHRNTRYGQLKVSPSTPFPTLVHRYKKFLNELAYEAVFQILETPEQKYFLLTACLATLPRFESAIHDKLAAVLMQAIYKLEKTYRPKWKELRKQFKETAERQFDNDISLAPLDEDESVFYYKIARQVEAERTIDLEKVETTPLTIGQATTKELEEFSLADFTLSTEQEALRAQVDKLQAERMPAAAYDPVTQYEKLRKETSPLGAQGHDLVRMFTAATPTNTAAAEIPTEYLNFDYEGTIRGLAVRVIYDSLYMPREQALDTAFASLPYFLSRDNKRHLQSLLLNTVVELEPTPERFHYINNLAGQAAFESFLNPLNQIAAVQQALDQLHADDEKFLFAELFKHAFNDLRYFAKAIKGIKAKYTQEKQKPLQVLREDIAIRKLGKTLKPAQERALLKLHSETKQNIASLELYLEERPEAGTAEYISFLARYAALSFSGNNKARIVGSVVALIPGGDLGQFDRELNYYVNHFDYLERHVLDVIHKINAEPSEHEALLLAATKRLRVQDTRDFYSFYDKHKHLVQLVPDRRRTYAPLRMPPAPPTPWEVTKTHARKGATAVTKVAPYLGKGATAVTKAAPYLGQVRWLTLAGALVVSNARTTIDEYMPMPTTVETGKEQTFAHFESHPRSVFMGRNNNGRPRAILLDNTPLPGVESVQIRANTSVVYFPMEIRVDQEPVNVHSALFGFMNTRRFREAFPDYRAGTVDQSTLLNGATGRLHHIQSHIKKNDVLTFGFTPQGNIVISSWRRGIVELVGSQPIEMDCRRLPHLGRFALLGNSEPPTPILRMTPISATSNLAVAYSAMETEIGKEAERSKLTQIPRTSRPSAWTELVNGTKTIYHNTLDKARRLLNRLMH